MTVTVNSTRIVPAAIPLMYPRGRRGDEGFKSFPLTYAFTTSSFGPVRFQSDIRYVNMDVIASMWLDNSQFSVPAQVTWAGTFQTIQIKSYSQGIFPVFTTPETIDLTIQLQSAPSANGTLSILLLNKEALPLQWPSL